MRKSGSDHHYDSEHYLTAIKSEPETVLLNKKGTNKHSKVHIDQKQKLFKEKDN